MSMFDQFTVAKYWERTTVPAQTMLKKWHDTFLRKLSDHEIAVNITDTRKYVTNVCLHFKVTHKVIPPVYSVSYL